MNEVNEWNVAAERKTDMSSLHNISNVNSKRRHQNTRLVPLAAASGAFTSLRKDILWCNHWFLCKMVSEKQAEKVHTNDASLPGSLAAQIWVVLRVSWKFCLLQPIRSSTQIWVVTRHRMEFMRSFLRHHFTGKPVVVSQNVGWFLRLSINKLNVVILILLHGSHRPWKVLENWKIVGYCRIALEFSTEVLEYFWKLLE